METVINPSATGATVVDTDKERGRHHDGGCGQRQFDNDWSRGAERVKDELSRQFGLAAAERSNAALRSVDQTTAIQLRIENLYAYAQRELSALAAKIDAQGADVKFLFQQAEIEKLKEQVADLKALKTPKVLPV